MLYQPVSQWHSLHFELLIELVAQKLTELWRFKNLDYFWPGDLVPWPTYLSMSHTGTAHPFHMWTEFGDDMSKRSWVMLDKTDRLTDRQTDRQTNRQTNILAKNCKFWQVISALINTHWLDAVGRKRMHKYWLIDRNSEIETYLFGYQCLSYSTCNRFYLLTHLTVYILDGLHPDFKSFVWNFWQCVDRWRYNMVYNNRSLTRGLTKDIACSNSEQSLLNMLWSK